MTLAFIVIWAIVFVPIRPGTNATEQYPRLVWNGGTSLQPRSNFSHGAGVLFMTTPVEKTSRQDERRRYYLANKESILAKNKAWRATPSAKDSNRIYQKDWRKKWMLKNRARHLAWRRAYYQKNRLKKLQEAKDYVSKNRELVLARRRHQYKSNPKHKEKMDEWRLNNLERHKQTVLRWRANNPERLKALRISSEGKRRSKLASASKEQTTAISDFIFKVKQKRFAVCYYCGGRIKTNDVRMDHITPLSLGGDHDISNMAVSCEPCNLRKSATPLSKWKPIGQQVLPL